nr:DUF4279 domain-containing protein [Paraburkholderia tuberum]
MTGDAVSPEFWTEYFQISPDTTIVKGKSFTLRSGKSSKAMGKTGLWELSSESTVQSDLLEPHLRYLIARRGMPREEALSISLACARSLMSGLLVPHHWSSDVPRAHDMHKDAAPRSRPCTADAQRAPAALRWRRSALRRGATRT